VGLAAFIAFVLILSADHGRLGPATTRWFGLFVVCLAPALILAAVWDWHRQQDPEQSKPALPEARVVGKSSK